MSYSYDGNGNVTTRTRNGIGTTYSYNGLDQLTGKTYGDYGSSHPTPWVSYSYNKGWLQSASAGNTVHQYTGYDSLGRVTDSTQTTNGGTAFAFHYVYNLAGGLTGLTLPSGRVVTTSYDGAGRVAGVSGTKGTVTASYASGISYAAQGAVRQMSLGNGWVEQRCYNGRLQVVGVRLGAGATGGCVDSGADAWNLEYHRLVARNSAGWLVESSFLRFHQRPKRYRTQIGLDHANSPFFCSTRT